MKIATLTFLLACSITVASAGSLRSDIEALDKTVHETMMRKDAVGFTKAMRAATTKDFKYVENGKTMSFDKMVEGIKSGFALMKKMLAADPKILTVKEKGNTGVATIQHNLSGIMVGPDKKNHTMTFTGVSTDIYRKEGGKWKMTSMTWTSQKMFMDGKPLAPGKSAG